MRTSSELKWLILTSQTSLHGQFLKVLRVAFEIRRQKLSLTFPVDYLNTHMFKQFTERIFLSSCPLTHMPDGSTQMRFLGGRRQAQLTTRSSLKTYLRAFCTKASVSWQQLWQAGTELAWPISLKMACQQSTQITRSSGHSDLTVMVWMASCHSSPVNARVSQWAGCPRAWLTSQQLSPALLMQPLPPS